MTNNPISHHVFVDFENVRNLNLDLLKDKPVNLLILLGAKQHNLPICLVKQLMEFKEQTQLIEVNVSGKNALDFVLAYYVGKLACQNPKNSFYIVSKDKGYDALVGHLKNNKIKAHRYDDLTQIPLFQQPKSIKPKDESTSIDRLTELLKQSARNRPAKRQSLITYADSVFAKKLAANEVAGLINQMQQKKLISFDEHNKVTYHF
ncbi:MAG: PIN domain-containing protein [Thiolinea sp.]